MSDYLARTPYRVIHVAGAPTIPHLLNQAAREADGEYLLLLDSACEALAPSWLAALVEHGQRPEVGAVGAKLLDAAGRIQHAGFILGLHGLASASHYGHDGYIDPGYLGFLRFTRNYSAISGACMLIRRELFLALGGFNEQELALAGSDLDLCLRLRRHGYLIVFTPRALLRRHRAEDPAPGAIDPGAEVYLRRTWADILADDPYYNPNQTREGPGFAVDFDKLEGTRYLYTSPPGATTINLLGVGRTVCQEFVASADGLCGVALRFGTHGQRCAGTMRFRMTRDGRPDLLVDTDAADIEDSCFHLFTFAPLDDSGGQRFCFTVEYVNPAPASALTIWRTAATDATVGPWRDNGVPQVGTLAFKTFVPGPSFRRFAHRAPDGLPLPGYSPAGKHQDLHAEVSSALVLSNGVAKQEDNSAPRAGAIGGQGAG